MKAHRIPGLRRLRACLGLGLAMAAGTTLHAQDANWQSRIWLGVVPGRDGVTLRVISTGCTRREDFEMAFDADGTARVSRLRPDRCRKRPSLVEFNYTFAELGIDEPRYFELRAHVSKP